MESLPRSGVDGISFTVHPMGGRGPSDPHPTVRVGPIRTVVNRTELSPAPHRQVSGAASPDSAIQCLHLFAPYVKYKVENIMKELTQLPTHSVLFVGAICSFQPTRSGSCPTPCISMDSPKLIMLQEA